MRMYNQYNKNEIEDVGTLVPDVIRLLLKDDEQVFFNPNDRVFITNQRVIICPRRRGQLEDIGFDQIKEVNRNIQNGINANPNRGRRRRHRNNEFKELRGIQNIRPFKTLWCWHRRQSNEQG